jgi:hypothetical protein
MGVDVPFCIVLRSKGERHKWNVGNRINRYGANGIRQW